MANMREVNKAIKAAYPDLKIELLRQDDYAYFVTPEGAVKFNPIHSNPPTTPTDAMIRMALDTIKTDLKEAAAYAAEADAKAPEQQHHFFAGNRYNWCTALDWEEAVQKLASQTDNDLINGHKRMTGGMVCVVCRVELPESAHYSISNYVPSTMIKDGERTDDLVPISNTDIISLLDNRGAWAKH